MNMNITPNKVLAILTGFCILSLCAVGLAQSPVDVRKTVSVPVTNAGGTVLSVREQRDITTNAIAGGSIGVTGSVTVTGQTGVTGSVSVTGITTYPQVGVTGTVTTTGQTGVTGSVTVTGITTYPQVGVTGSVAITAASLPLPTGAATLAAQQSQTNNEATMITAFQNMTNYLSPYNQKISWNPTTLSSNNVTGSAATLGWLMSINTNSAPVQLIIWDSPVPVALGNAPAYQLPIPSITTTGAGFVLPIPSGGQRFTGGVQMAVTGGGSTNAAIAGGVWFIGGYKP